MTALMIQLLFYWLLCYRLKLWPCC